MPAKLWLSRSRSRSKAQPSWAALSSTSPVQACFWGDKDGEWRWPTLQDFSSFRCLCSQPYHIHSSSSKLHTSYERSSDCCRHWIQICCYRAASRFIATRTRNSENSQSTRSSRFQLQPNPTPAQQQQSAAPHQNTIPRLLVLLLLLKKNQLIFLLLHLLQLLYLTMPTRWYLSATSHGCCCCWTLSPAAAPSTRVVCLRWSGHPHTPFDTASWQPSIEIDSVEQIYIHDIISKQRVLCFNTTTQQNSCLHTCKSNNTWNNQNKAFKYSI